MHKSPLKNLCQNRAKFEVTVQPAPGSVTVIKCKFSRRQNKNHILLDTQTKQHSTNYITVLYNCDYIMLFKKTIQLELTFSMK